jgi:hypothetical protein
MFWLVLLFWCWIVLNEVVLIPPLVQVWHRGNRLILDRLEQSSRFVPLLLHLQLFVEIRMWLGVRDVWAGFRSLSLFTIDKNS